MASGVPRAVDILGLAAASLAVFESKPEHTSTLYNTTETT